MERDRRKGVPQCSQKWKYFLVPENEDGRREMEIMILYFVCFNIFSNTRMPLAARHTIGVHAAFLVVKNVSCSFPSFVVTISVWSSI